MNPINAFTDFPTEIVEIAKKIKLVICDVDGVLTDGVFHFTATGVGQLAFHVRDGYGLKLIMSSGLDVGIITTSNNAIVDKRIANLGIYHYYKGQFDKLVAYEDLKALLQLEDDEIAYIGDDLPDLPVVERVGLGVAVADANEQLRKVATWITTKNGGHGAVREVCDLILQAQNTREIAVKKFQAEHQPKHLEKNTPAQTD